MIIKILCAIAAVLCVINGVIFTYGGFIALYQGNMENVAKSASLVFFMTLAGSICILEVTRNE